MRTLLYCRQSVEREDGEQSLSLDSQASALRQWAADQDWTVVGEIREAGEKGWDDTRPGLVEAMARATRREYDILAVWKINRLARSVRIQENTLHDLARHGIDVRSLTEPWVGQPMFRQILGAVAEEQTRLISADSRRGTHERARRGLWSGKAPYGYMIDPESGRLAIDADHPERVALIGEFFRRYAAHESYLSIARDLNARGVPAPNGGGWWHVTVQEVLERPAYRGAVVCGSTVTEDAHPAIVDAPLWAAAQSRRQRKYTSHHTRADSWLVGNLIHACGAPMSLRRPEGNRPRSWRFQCYRPYRTGEPERCDSRPAAIAREKAEAAVWALILSTFADIISPADAISKLTRQLKAQAPQAARERAALEQRLVKLRGRRQRAEELYLSGDRDRVWFAAEDQKVRQAEAEITATLAALPQPPDPVAIRRQHAQMTRLAEILPTIAPMHRGEVLAVVGVAIMEPGSSPRQPAFRLQLKPEIRPLVSQDEG